MASFSEIITVDKNDLFFCFNGISAPESQLFYVTVALSGSSSISFDMKKTETGQWNINKPVPKWIINLEPELSNAIASHT